MACSGARPDATSSRSRTTVIRGASASGRGAGRSARSGRGRRRSPRELDPVLVGLVDRVTRRMRKAGRSGGRWCCACASTISLAPPGRTHCPYATSHTETVLAAARGLLAAALPLLERARAAPCSGSRSRNLDNRPVQLTLPLDAQAGARLDAAVDEVRARFGVEGADARRAPRPRPGLRGPDAPRLGDDARAGRLEAGKHGLADSEVEPVQRLRG